MKKKCIEVTRDDAKGYLTSNYPVGRENDFKDEKCLVTLAISPTQALVFSNEAVCQGIAASPKNEQWRMIDLQTLARASDAFTLFATEDHFVSRHIGWKLQKKVTLPTYFSNAMNEPYD